MQVGVHVKKFTEVCLWVCLVILFLSLSFMDLYNVKSKLHPDSVGTNIHVLFGYVVLTSGVYRYMQDC